MNNTEIIDNYYDEVSKLLDYYRNNKDAINEYYLNNFSVYRTSDVGEVRIPSIDSFDGLYSDTIKKLETEKDFIEKLKKVKVSDSTNYSKQCKKLYESCIENISNADLSEYDKDYLIFNPHLVCIFKYYYSIILLQDFFEIESNIVLLGANGSGKTMFAQTLKGDEHENIFVIPAQKTLFYLEDDETLLKSTSVDCEEAMLSNVAEESKSNRDYGYSKYLKTQFSKLLISTKNNHYTYLIKREKNEEIETSYFLQMKEIIEELFEGLEITFDTDNKTNEFECIKNGQKYHINALSEGEKSAIYYTLSVLNARDNGFIIVDEPETYLNPALFNKLWDKLEKVKSDCQFIYITHSVQFVNGRNNCQIVWIENYEYPANWKFKKISKSSEIPQQNLTEILGSKKPILFCEGIDESRDDYKIYNILFGEQFTVIPVGGCKEVIKNVKAINKSELIETKCYGIVDGDYHSNDVVETYRKNNVYTLPFNEIEMFYMCEEMLDATLERIYPADYKAKIQQIKVEFKDIVYNKVDEIALAQTKAIIDEKISSKKIQNFNSIEGIETSLSNIIDDFNIHDLFNERKVAITDCVDNDYLGLLKNCNLKNDILASLRKHVTPDYKESAIQQLKTNIKLQNDVKEKYFPEYFES